MSAGLLGLGFQRDLKPACRPHRSSRSKKVLIRGPNRTRQSQRGALQRAEISIVAAKSAVAYPLPLNSGQLVQERFPVAWHSLFGAGSGLIPGMRIRRNQLRTLNHLLLFVVVEPDFAWLKAGDDRMPRLFRML